MTGDADPERVGERTRRGLSWNLAGAVLTNAMRLAVVAVLGRALDSKDFGIVAAALSVNILFYSVRDLGVGQALVQLRDIERRHVATAFAISTYLGLALSALMVLAAPGIARLYRIDEATDVIRAIGLLFVLRGMSIASRGLCQREMNFRVIALVDAGAFTAGSITSMTLAVQGFGAWSLVVGYVAEEALATLAFLLLRRPPYAVRVDRSALRDLMSFGKSYSLSQIAAVLALYGDNLVVGHQLGARMLGFYTRAYDLIRFPSALFDNLVGSVLFPAFARMQDDASQLAASFRRSLFATAVVLLPASGALFVVAPEMIRVLMGPGWEPAVMPFRVLVLTMMMRTSAKVGQMLASAVGGIRGVAIVNVIYMACVVGGAAIAVRWGIVGVSASTAVAITAMFVGFMVLASHLTGLRLAHVAKAHGPGLGLAAIAALAAFAIAHPLRAIAAPTAVVFAAVAVGSVAATAGVGGIAIWRRWGEFAWLRDEVARLRSRSR